MQTWQLSTSCVEALLTLGNLHSGETLLALFSLIFTALLMARKSFGLLIGVAVTTILFLCYWPFHNA